MLNQLHLQINRASRRYNSRNVEGEPNLNESVKINLITRKLKN